MTGGKAWGRRERPHRKQSLQRARRRRDHFGSAVLEVRGGDPTWAEELAAEAWTWIDEGDPAGWLNVALAYFALGAHRRELWALKRSVSAQDPKGLAMAAQGLWIDGRLRKARRLIARARRLRDSDADRALEIVLRGESKEPLALEDYEWALQWRPEATLGIARVLERRGDRAFAIVHCAKEFAAGRTWVGPMWGRMLADEGRIEEAREAYLLSLEAGEPEGAVGLCAYARRAADLGVRDARRWLSRRQRARRAARRRGGDSLRQSWV